MVDLSRDNIDRGSRMESSIFLGYL